MLHYRVNDVDDLLLFDNPDFPGGTGILHEVPEVFENFIQKAVESEGSVRVCMQEDTDDSILFQDKGCEQVICFFSGRFACKVEDFPVFDGKFVNFVQTVFAGVGEKLYELFRRDVFEIKAVFCRVSGVVQLQEFGPCDCLFFQERTDTVDLLRAHVKGVLFPAVVFGPVTK